MPAALAILGMLGGASILPPYLGPAVGLELHGISSTVEVVDHVIPGLTVIAFSVISLLLLRAGRPSDSLPLLFAIALCMLAGLWETSSHVPLVLQAGEPEAPWDAVLLHSLLGPTILLLSIALLARMLAPRPGEEQPSS